jgi:hypothetical protein
MKKYNCWEILQCGREEGGTKVEELGRCLATKDGLGNGVNAGKCSGRICWAIAGTLCGGEVQGTFAKKRKSCLLCPMYLLVKEEEGEGFQEILPGQDPEV